MQDFEIQYVQPPYMHSKQHWFTLKSLRRIMYYSLLFPFYTLLCFIIPLLLCCIMSIACIHTLSDFFISIFAVHIIVLIVATIICLTNLMAEYRASFKRIHTHEDMHEIIVIDICAFIYLSMTLIHTIHGILQSIISLS